MLEISLNMYHAVALGAFLFWLGGVITSKISLLNRYCIPAPLVGGLCFSIVNCILYSTGAASITFDDTLQSVFMIMFFTTVGFTVSIPALLKGGKAVLLCLLVAVVMIPVQNFLGGGVMALFGKDPLLGIGCGSIALVGGPGTAAAYGPELEAAGSSTNTGSAPTAPRCAPARPAQRSWPPMWPARTRPSPAAAPALSRASWSFCWLWASVAR